MTVNGKNRSAKVQMLRTKISAHDQTQCHKAAVKILNEAKKNVLPELISQSQSKYNETTARLMRTAYAIAKNNRPYVAYEEMCQLQEANGVKLGKGLHSRYSATEMIDCIANSMRKKLCTTIQENKLKISIILDESTTISRKSCLVLYIRSAWPNKVSADCFSFPVSLIELESLTAKHITEAVIQTLHSNGFNEQYLNHNLVGACSDGASVMLGKYSGVLTQLRSKFPNLFLWHCMCHRIELAVGDAVKSVSQVNHVKSMLDKLYSIYSQSPKMQRELELCAQAVGSELNKVGRVLGVRWVASSYQSLLAVWKSYRALYAHSCESISAGKPKHKSTFSGLKTTFESKEFVHSLAVMLDALKELSILSKTLQGESCSLTDAFKLLKRTIRALKNQKDGHGDFYKEYLICMNSGTFRDIQLGSKGTFLNKDAFLQALVDNLTSRMNRNVSLEDGIEINALLDSFDVLNSSKWPAGVESPWVSGEIKLKNICDLFSLSIDEFREDFRNFIDDPISQPNSIVRLQSIVNTLPVSSADCERGFSLMNVICSDLRSTLTVQHISNLMLISLVGPPVVRFNPDPYVKIWLRSNHRSADDTRTRIVQAKHCVRYANLWEFL